jgi:ferrochelatase
VTRGLLLVNLGTPLSSDVRDVRAFLGEFLMDRYVLDVPWLLRRLIVTGFILPFRPNQTARAYAKIWNAAGPETGSPLLHYSELCRHGVEERTGMPTALAMRYGTPSVRDAIAALLGHGVRQITMLPLYPQHADSTITTSIEAVRRSLPTNVSLTVVPPFYSQPDYLDAQAAAIRENLPASWDHLLFSYHGLPERHITKADPTGNHCLALENCCQIPSEAHATCYRHQVYRTSELLAQRLGLSEDQYSVSFQSRLGRLPWLTPYTDQVLEALPGKGVRRLAVTCPAFVADNLETLEEIGIAGRESFLAAGGESFSLVPCLNDRADWIDAIVRIAGAA